MSSKVQFGIVEVAGTSRIGNVVVPVASSRKLLDYQELTPTGASQQSSVVASAGVVGDRPDQFMWFVSVGQEAGDVHVAFGPDPTAGPTNGPMLGPGDYYRTVDQVGDRVAVIVAS